MVSKYCFVHSYSQGYRKHPPPPLIPFPSSLPYSFPMFGPYLFLFLFLLSIFILTLIIACELCREGGNASGNGGERAGGARLQGSGGGGVFDDGGGKPESNALPPMRLLAFLIFCFVREKPMLPT